MMSLVLGHLRDYWDVPAVMLLVPGTSVGLLGCSSDDVTCPSDDVTCPRDMSLVLGISAELLGHSSYPYFLSLGHLVDLG